VERTNSEPDSKPLRLAEETVNFVHICKRSLRPAFLRNRKLRFFSHWLDILRIPGEIIQRVRESLEKAGQVGVYTDLIQCISTMVELGMAPTLTERTRIASAGVVRSSPSA
jgi:hypothetical protein